jgi:N-acetylglucosamine-6-phosphate deacetylase
MDITEQIGTIKQILEDYFRRYFVKDFEKLAELQNMIEDVTLTPEEREKKQAIREQKKKDYETQKAMLAE